MIVCMPISTDHARWAVRLTVARPGGWRAWAEVGPDFERDIIAQASDTIFDPRVEGISRRGAEQVRVNIAMTVTAVDIGQAATAAWWVFRKAADDGWDAEDAIADIRPERNAGKLRLWEAIQARARRPTSTGMTN